jgi:hypothetical protein
VTTPSPTLLPTGYVGEKYGALIPEPSGPVGATYSWALTGGSLPAGLTLSQTAGFPAASISGTPLQPGTFIFLITVTGSYPTNTWYEIVVDF